MTVVFICRGFPYINRALWEAGGFKAWSTECMSFDWKTRLRIVQVRFEIIIRYQTNKISNDRVCKKKKTNMQHSWTKSNIVPPIQRVYLTSVPYPAQCSSRSSLAWINLLGKENSDCKVFEWDEKKCLELCKVKPRIQKEEITQGFEEALANCSLC